MHVTNEMSLLFKDIQGLGRFLHKFDVVWAGLFVCLGMLYLVYWGHF